MNNEKINKYLDSHSSISYLVHPKEGLWTFEFTNISAYIMTDDRQGVDRMRIMSLICQNPQAFPTISAEILLRANCHKALDARFCYENDGSLWSAFIHRLSTLDEADLESGLQQVIKLVQGFPINLSSLDLYFRGQ